jgi:hypothetical protein
MKYLLNKLNISVNKEFVGKIKFVDLLETIRKCIVEVHAHNKLAMEHDDMEHDDQFEYYDAMASRFQEILGILTLAYTFGKDVTYS